MMILGFTGSLLCVGSPQTADFRNRASYLFAMIFMHLILYLVIV